MRPNQRPTLDLSLPGTTTAATSHLPDISTVLPWRTWDEGREEAQRRGMPIFAFAEPVWANSTQRIALRLEQEVALRELLTSRVIPVLVDPNERPDLAAAWRWAAVALTGTSGPPLMVFLTHEGLPFLAYCTMAIEGDATYPSLTSLVHSIADSYENDRTAIVEEARQLTRRDVPAAVVDQHTWDAFREQLDTRRGGLHELPKHPYPTLLWTLLNAKAVDALPGDVENWLDLTLDALIRGGIWDQIDRGFHRAVRDEMWVVPHFEKPIPLNAQLSAVYARAAHVLGNERYGDIASRLVSFCVAALREDVDAIGSDTGYYTWTSRELLKTLDASLVQVVTLHYDIKPVDERQALRRVVEMEQMDRFSHEDVSVLQTRLMRGRAQMRAARLRRAAPESVSLSSPGWQAATIRWLLEASVWTETVAVPDIIKKLDQLVDGHFQHEKAYAQATGASEAGTVWLQDQAALLAAFLAAHRATEDATWLERARELADVLTSSYWSDSGWTDTPAGVASMDVIDDILPATISTLTDSLYTLAEATGAPKIARIADLSRKQAQRLGAASGHWSAMIPTRQVHGTNPGSL